MPSRGTHKMRSAQREYAILSRSRRSLTYEVLEARHLMAIDPLSLAATGAVLTAHPLAGRLTTATIASGIHQIAGRAAAASNTTILPSAAPQTASPSTIFDVQPVAVDQPQINGLLQVPGGPPTDPIYNIQAFLDTGSSGVLISNESAAVLNLNNLVVDGNGNPVTFSDVGIGGSDDFHVTQPMNVQIGSFPTAGPPYNQTFNSLHLEVGPLPPPTDPNLQNLDVFGMPVMSGKVTVIDPKPANELFDYTHSYIYNPGTPFNASAAGTDPGIPTTNHHVLLSYGQFDRFTQVTPAGFPGATFVHNPFIGPNPVAQLDPNPPVDNTPPVTFDYNGLHSSGSFLFDTGAVTSFISQHEAANLHVRYVAGTFGTATPKLETFDPANPAAPGTLVANQFTLAVGGIGGTVTSAGFFLDHMILHTQEGSPSDADPNNIRFVSAPVLVDDISVEDPNTLQTLTLDGDFGMNYLMTSVNLNPDGTFGAFAVGAFNWITLDEPNGVLGLDTMPPATAPSAVVGRNLFYQGSTKWDVTSASLPGFSDDNAIATDKSAYLPGSGAATFANVSSFDRGINGIMVDLLGGGSHTSIALANILDDFSFKVGNNNSPGTWAAAPNPLSVTVRSGAGVSGSDRVELIWANGAIQQQWLEVTTKATPDTGLAANDVFFFGNEIGATGTSNTATIAKVTSSDVTGAQTHGATIKANIPITNIYDFNKDGQVGAADVTDVQTHGTTNKTGLNFINIGAGGPFAPVAAPATAAASGDAGIASALASTTTSTTTQTIPPSIEYRLSQFDLHGINLNKGAIAKYFEHLAHEGTPRAKAILTNADEIADVLNLDDTLLDALLAGLGLT